MGEVVRLKYAGSTPGADSSTYNLLNTALSTNFMPANLAQALGLRWFNWDISNDKVCTLKGYKSGDRGTTWTQFYERVVPPSPNTATAANGLSVMPQSNWGQVYIEDFQDVKFDIVNGGSAQGTWLVDLSLASSRANAAYLDVEKMGYFTAVAMTASRTGNPILVGPQRRLSMYIAWTNGAAGNPVGTFTLEGSTDGTTWKKYDDADAQFTSQPNSNSGTLACTWREVPFTLARLVYTRSSGGTAETITVDVHTE